MCGKQSILKPSARMVWAILALAFLLRLIWAIAVPVQPLSDGVAYDAFAQNMVNGLGFGWQAGAPTAHWPPGVSLTYAVFYFIFGHTYVPIVVLNLALGVFIVAAAMQLAAWWFNPRVSWVTGFLLALWLNLIEFTTILASELLFCALLLGALLLWEHPMYRRTIRALGAGALLAAACYMRPLGLALPVVFLFFEWRRARISSSSHAIRAVLAATALLLAAMAVVIAPWTIRNVVTFGRVVLISDNDGDVFWAGNNAASDGSTVQPIPQLPGQTDANIEGYLMAQTFAYVSAHPLDFAAGMVKKLVLTHSRESIGVVWNEDGLTARWGAGVLLPLKVINAAYWYVMLALGLAGIGLVWKTLGWRGLVAQPPLWLWAYFAGIAAIFLGQDRYHIPSIPAIAMFAAYTLVYVYQTTRVPATRLLEQSAVSET